MKRIDAILEDLKHLEAFGLGDVTISDLKEILEIIKAKVPKNDFMVDYERKQKFIHSLLDTDQS